MSKNSKKIYICDYCGEEQITWSGKCNNCGNWNTLKEITVAHESNNNHYNNDLEIKKISEIKNDENIRIKTGMLELDRVLGGGLIRGSVILLGGEPGIGKSTITTQLCKTLNNTFYISAEESLSQIKNRVNRLKIGNNDFNLVSNGDLLLLEKEIIKQKPDLLIIDSIQTVYMSNLDSSAGSISQVKESGLFLQRLAKKNDISVLIIGHVTKEGTIAGPKIIEHLVDVVLYFEGEKHHEERIIRGIKNRFGPTNEIGIFTMNNDGLKEMANPTEFYLSQRENKAGSVICPIMEGRRILFIEIQALTIITKFGYPKRTASGYDLNRLNILSAVIQKSTGMNLANYDIYLNIVGGLKIKEPAADLAISAAIMSSYKNKPYEINSCIFGEVGLMGEIRRVSGEQNRTKESKQLGYKTISQAEVKDLSQFLDKYL